MKFGLYEKNSYGEWVEWAKLDTEDDARMVAIALAEEYDGTGRNFYYDTLNALGTAIVARTRAYPSWVKR